MRILLSQESRKILFLNLKEEYSCKSLLSLAIQMKISKNTIGEWIYNKRRYIPEKIIPSKLKNKLKILDKKEENWGRVKGGENTYKIILKKYGEEEMQRRRSLGGKKSQKNRKNISPLLNLDLEDENILEFYGALLGDGWMSRLKNKNKIISLIGFSGHKRLDREYFLYLESIIKNLFNRKPYFKEIKGNNGAELLFSHKELQKFFNTKLNFPIGKKIDLEIDKIFLDKDFDKTKFIIRGIFDTDGSFYLDKTPSGNSYPCISIEMKAPKLIEQIFLILKKNGFKVSHRVRERSSRITLKGRKQLDKWMEIVGSSNPKHLNKIKALVTQPG